MLVSLAKSSCRRLTTPPKVRIIRRRYTLLHPPNSITDQSEITLYVKGFLGRGESADDFHEWFKCHHLIATSGKKNWNQKVVGFRWQNGDVPIPLPLVSGALIAYRLLKLKSSLLKLTPMGLAASLSVDAALYAGMLATEYYKADKSVEEQSLVLAENLLNMNATHAKVRVVAHSLGCRLLHHAVANIPQERRPHEVHLLAPAFTELEVAPNLDALAQDSLKVYHNKDDYILSLLYTGITGGGQAVGCAGLTGKYSDRVSQVDTSPHFDWLVHTEYRNSFHKFVL